MKKMSNPEETEKLGGGEIERRFQRRIEAFTCAVCGTQVQGNGYTDHCPSCLWGQHVDVNPGDRAAECQGMMEPVGALVPAGKTPRIFYRCAGCGHERFNDAAPEDNIDEIIRLSAMPIVQHQRPATAPLSQRRGGYHKKGGKK